MPTLENTRKSRQSLRVFGGLFVALIGVLALFYFSNHRDHAVRLVVLSPQGCVAAVQLNVPTTANESGCTVQEPDMFKYGDEVVLQQGKSVSTALVTAWSK